MKPGLPLRDTVPMATASSARLQHPLLFISSSAHLCTKAGQETSQGEWRGAGDWVPSQDCEERWETKGWFCLESHGEASLGGQQSHDTPLQPHEMSDGQTPNPSFHFSPDIPRRLVWG